MEASPKLMINSRFSWSFIIRSRCTITLLVFVHHALPSTGLSTNEFDGLVLLDFKNKISSDPRGFLNSWNDSFHFCEWRGINCTLGKRVSGLDLRSQGLVGTLSPSLSNLTFLTVIELRNNNLFGSIPPEFSKLSRLQRLMLVFSKFSKLSCSALEVLDLFGNKLQGPIPQQIGYLPNLIFLVLSQNNLSGCIPPSFVGHNSIFPLQSLHLANVVGGG